MSASRIKANRTTRRKKMKEEENKHSSPKYYPQTKFRGIFKE